jgi:hypothetical protein
LALKFSTIIGIVLKPFRSAAQPDVVTGSLLVSVTSRHSPARARMMSGSTGTPALSLP